MDIRDGCDRRVEKKNFKALSNIQKLVFLNGARQDFLPIANPKTPKSPNSSSPDKHAVNSQVNRPTLANNPAYSIPAFHGIQCIPHSRLSPFLIANAAATKQTAADATNAVIPPAFAAFFRLVDFVSGSK